MNMKAFAAPARKRRELVAARPNASSARKSQRATTRPGMLAGRRSAALTFSHFQ
jgi:hypothetical protein